MMDEVTITTDIQAADQLGLLLRKLQLESPRKGNIQKQAKEIVAKVTYLGCELKVIEVDGISGAVQIRSKKPAEDGFVEIILRDGNRLSLERKPTALHLSKGDFDRLIRDLKEIF